MLSIPNILTLLRIATIPFIVIFYYVPVPHHHEIAAIIFIIAAITDWLDGYLARYWKQTSSFGAFLDPVADKLLVAVALVLIVAEHMLPFIAIPAVIIVGREIIVSGLREWMAEIGKRTSLAVSFVAKTKTLIQMLALMFLLSENPHQITWVAYLGYGMLIVAAVMTLWSMTVYLRIAWPDLSSQ